MALGQDGRKDESRGDQIDGSHLGVRQQQLECIRADASSCWGASANEQVEVTSRPSSVDRRRSVGARETASGYLR